MNKNQRQFFLEAIPYFRNKGYDLSNIKFKDLKFFSDETKLILPTSFLKKCCRNENTMRGYYDLTLLENMVELSESFKVKEEIEEVVYNKEIIKEASVFLDDGNKSKKNIDRSKKLAKKSFNNRRKCVYCVFSNEGDLTHVCENPEKSYHVIKNEIFHSSCDKSINTFLKDIEKKGHCLLRSNTARIFSYVIKYSVI